MNPYPVAKIGRLVDSTSSKATLKRGKRGRWSDAGVPTFLYTTTP